MTPAIIFTASALTSPRSLAILSASRVLSWASRSSSQSFFHSSRSLATCFSSRGKIIHPMSSEATQIPATPPFVRNGMYVVISDHDTPVAPIGLFA